MGLVTASGTFEDSWFIEVDRATDPGETENLFARDRARATGLRDGLLRDLGADGSLLAGRWREPLLDSSSESRRRLRALGYF